MFLEDDELKVLEFMIDRFRSIEGKFDLGGKSNSEELQVLLTLGLMKKNKYNYFLRSNSI